MRRLVLAGGLASFALAIYLWYQAGPAKQVVVRRASPAGTLSFTTHGGRVSHVIADCDTVDLYTVVADADTVEIRVIDLEWR